MSRLIEVSPDGAISPILVGYINTSDYEIIKKQYYDSYDKTKEPLLTGIIKKNYEKYIFANINPEYKDLWDLFDRQVRAVWTYHEIDISDDIKQWNSITFPPMIKNYTTKIMANFAVLDGAVTHNIVTNFHEEIKIPEARACLGYNGGIEVVHGVTYCMFILGLLSPEEAKKAFAAAELSNSIKKRLEFCEKWMNPNIPFPLRILAFGLVEGLLFCTSFSGINFMKRLGYLPGFTHSNELISADESLHFDTACCFNRHVKQKVPDILFYSLLFDAVVVEQIFVQETYETNTVGINRATMSNYAYYMADFVAKKFGYDPVYGVKHQCSWMEINDVDVKINFFERRNSQYETAQQNTNSNNNEFLLTEDF